jgi:predicted alpha/beta-fold hydrolase
MHWRRINSSRGTGAANEFRPLPLLSNPHVQTLLGHWWNGTTEPFGSRERYVQLPDGDCLVLHDSQPWLGRAGRPVVLLIHGLSGTHRSGYMLRMAARLLAHNLRVVRIDLRGCGRGAGLARHTYNGGCSEDIRAALAEIHAWDEKAPLWLLGFSLGGNIALKLAGEAADHPVPGLCRVAALAPPIDLERCAALIALPRNRIYERHFTQSLVSQIRRHERRFRDLPRTRFPQNLTMRQFDDLYTAPHGGFRDALDYYRQSSAAPLIRRITVATLMLTARDDPFVAIEPFEHLTVPPHVEVQIVPRGGHLGFLGRDTAGGVRWAERRIAEWLTAACGAPH